MFAGIDSLIGFLIFVLISALISWLQRKRGGEEEQEAPIPPRPRQRPTGVPAPPPVQAPPKAASWEEELKRLLEGQLSEPETAPPPPPPIIVQTPRPSPVPPSPPVEIRESPAPATRSPVEVAFRPLPPLTESVQAYEQAATLEQKVEQHLREVTAKPVELTKVQRREPPPEAARALALLRNRPSLRATVLASVILGPPRALADRRAADPMGMPLGL